MFVEVYVLDEVSILRTDEFAFREIFRTNSRYCMYSFSFETTYEDTSSGSQSRARDVVQLSRRESCPDFVSSNATFPPCPDEEADLCVHIQFEFCFSFLSRSIDVRTQIFFQTVTQEIMRLEHYKHISGHSRWFGT